MKEKQPRTKKVVLKELPVMPEDSGTITAAFTAHRLGTLKLVFEYQDEVSLFDISEFQLNS